MKKNTPHSLLTLFLTIVIALSSCTMPSAAETTPPPLPVLTDVPASTSSAPAGGVANALPTFAPPTATPSIAHVLIPATNINTGKLTYDVTSVDTAAELRAPYGDSYKINRFERPFSQDMTYLPDVDIASYSLDKDEKFYYVAIQLIGTNPNNDLGINYVVELDTNADGFGDYAIVAHPFYSIDWTTDNVQVFKDKNRDTGGLSAERSDAPLPGDGYETLIFNGGRGEKDDPDLAWVRVNAGRYATVQFAFKIELAETRFMYGVYADAGLKDVGKLDYVDRLTESEAGSPEREEKEYPLKALFAVDNVCRDVYGFVGHGEEPQRCPVQIKPEGNPNACPQPSSCAVWDAENCVCLQQSAICLSQGTLIDTPNGSISVETLKIGDLVWTINQAGERIAAPILKVSSPFVEPNHKMAYITLADQRTLWVSPGHPTVDGKNIGDLKPGDILDGSEVISLEISTYDHASTYDILPEGGTGYYWANGILIGSTLK